MSKYGKVRAATSTAKPRWLADVELHNAVDSWAALVGLDVDADHARCGTTLDNSLPS